MKTKVIFAAFILVLAASLGFASECVAKCPDGLLKFGTNTCSNGVCTDCAIDCTGHSLPAKPITQPPAELIPVNQPITQPPVQRVHVEQSPTGMSIAMPNMSQIYMIILILVIAVSAVFYFKSMKKRANSIQSFIRA